MQNASRALPSVVFLALSLVALLAAAACRGPGNASPGPRLVHSVYFTLREDTLERRAALVASCREHLAPIEGIACFSAGTRDEGLVREVNDLDFDVALTIVFRDRPAHDRYQTDERHLRFIAENRDGWENVRVFDSLDGGR